MSVVVNRVAACYAPGSGRPLVRTRYVVVHHCSLKNLAPGNPRPIPDDFLDAPSLAGRFTDLGLGTGGRPPYHGLTTLSESNEQILPLSIRGSHSIGYNYESLAWCLVGEDRPAPDRQIAAAADAVALLVLFAGGAEIVGHADLPGATGDTGKRCPWPTVDIQQFRLMVRDRLPHDWRSRSRADIEALVRQGGFVI